MPCWARTLDSPAPTTHATARISVSLDIPKQRRSSPLPFSTPSFAYGSSPRKSLFKNSDRLTNRFFSFSPFRQFGGCFTMSRLYPGFGSGKKPFIATYTVRSVSNQEGTSLGPNRGLLLHRCILYRFLRSTSYKHVPPFPAHSFPPLTNNQPFARMSRLGAGAPGERRQGDPPGGGLSRRLAPQAPVPPYVQSPQRAAAGQAADGQQGEGPPGRGQDQSQGAAGRREEARGPAIGPVLRAHGVFRPEGRRVHPELDDAVSAAARRRPGRVC